MTKKEMILLDTVEEQFRKVDKIPLSAIPKLQAIIRQSPNEVLEVMIKRRIKFCDTVANSELVRRGVYPETAKFDHLIDVLQT